MSANGRRDDTCRVVVTGMGVVTPIGETPAEFSASLRAGRSGITRWKHMDERTLSKIGGDMCDFDLAAHFERGGAAPWGLASWPRVSRGAGRYIPQTGSGGGRRPGPPRP